MPAHLIDRKVTSTSTPVDTKLIPVNRSYRSQQLPVTVKVNCAPTTTQATDRFSETQIGDRSAHRANPSAVTDNDAGGLCFHFPAHTRHIRGRDHLRNVPN
jgi:hypothetical protein